MKKIPRPLASRAWFGDRHRHSLITPQEYRNGRRDKRSPLAFRLRSARTRQARHRAVMAALNLTKEHNP